MNDIFYGLPPALVFEELIDMEKPKPKQTGRNETAEDETEEKPTSLYKSVHLSKS